MITPNVSFCILSC